MLISYHSIKKILRKKVSNATGASFVYSPMIPCLIDGHICERVFLYSAGSGKRSRPYITALISSESGILLEYKNSYGSEFADAEKYPLDAEMDYSVPTAKTVEEQAELVNKLESYTEKIREIAFKDNLSSDERRTISEYSECLRKTMPNELLSFIMDIEKPFFKWIDDNV